MAKPSQDNWFSYEWDVRGAHALFTVDTAYEEPSAGYETLLYIALSPREDDVEEFTPRMLRHADKMTKRILRALPEAKYVGVIEMDALRQLYFYVQDGDEAAQIVRDAARKEKLIAVTPGTAPEPDWLSYHALLLPDAAKYQTVLNAEVIERLKRNGDGFDHRAQDHVLALLPFRTDARHVSGTGAAEWLRHRRAAVSARAGASARADHPRPLCA